MVYRMYLLIWLHVSLWKRKFENEVHHNIVLVLPSHVRNGVICHKVVHIFTMK